MASRSENPHSLSEKVMESVLEEQTTGARLEVMSGPEDGRVFPLSAAEVVIGRSNDCEISLSLDRSASRRHARIYGEEPEEGGAAAYYLDDLGSRNGTELDGHLLTVSTRLRDGAMILVGDTYLQFRLADDSAE